MLVLFRSSVSFHADLIGNPFKSMNVQTQLEVCPGTSTYSTSKSLSRPNFCITKLNGLEVAWFNQTLSVYFQLLHRIHMGLKCSNCHRIVIGFGFFSQILCLILQDTVLQLQVSNQSWITVIGNSCIIHSFHTYLMMFAMKASTFLKILNTGFIWLFLLDGRVALKFICLMHFVYFLLRCVTIDYFYIIFVYFLFRQPPILNAKSHYKTLLSHRTQFLPFQWNIGSIVLSQFCTCCH